MKTSPELLSDILNVLGKINSNIESIKGTGGKSSTGKETKGSKESKAAAGMSMNLGDLASGKKTHEGVKDTASAIKDLSTSLGPLSSGLIKFGLVPNRYKLGLTDFINTLLQQSTINNINAKVRAKEIAEAIGIISDSLPKLVKGLFMFGLLPGSFKRSLFVFMKDILQLGTSSTVKKAKTSAEAMNILGEALPKLAKGVFVFGIAQKIGLVSATSKGLKSLYDVFLFIGNPATQEIVVVAALSIAAVGVALIGLSKVLSSIAKVILAFSAAIVIIVGAIWLATKLFTTAEGKKIGPLAAMGIIIGSIGILAAGFAIIGALGGLIALGGIAIASMGKGLMWAAGGLLSIVGAFWLMNKMTKDDTGEKAKEFLWIGAGAIGLFGLMFVGLGLFHGKIKDGGKATQEMGKGMVWIAGGLLALGGVYALLTKVFKLDFGETISNLAVGIAILGLTFAGLGLFSLLIIPGTVALIAMGISIGIFALIAWGVGAVIKEIGGTKGLEDMSTNIELLIGGVLTGVIKGVKKGLLGDTSSTGIFKIFDVAKNVAVLIGAVFMLMAVSYALMMFAFTIKAFTTAGVIKTVTGYDANGNPIYGDSVNVVSAGENIAKSIGAFFSTLTKTFKDPTIIPKKEDMIKISDILIGEQGARYLFSQKRVQKTPSLIDVLAKFANVISIFAKVKQMPVYDIDAKGNTKLVGYVKPETIATNMVDTIKAFFKAFDGKKTELSNLSTETSYNIAEVLLGKSAFKLFGLKFGRAEGKPGIIDALQKFSEVIMTYSRFGTENKIYTEFNDDGTPKPGSGVAVTDVANNMVKGISSFLSAFLNAFSINRMGQNSSIETVSQTIISKMTKFSDMISKLNDVGKNVDGIDKLAASLGALGTNIGVLQTNMGALNTDNLEKLSKVTAEYAIKTKGITPVTIEQSQTAIQASQPDWDAIAEKIGQKVAEKMVGLNTGEFKFQFMDTNVGNLSIKR